MQQFRNLRSKNLLGVSRNLYFRTSVRTGRGFLDFGNARVLFLNHNECGRPEFSKRGGGGKGEKRGKG
jgi:hypothetical protein